MATTSIGPLLRQLRKILDPTHGPSVGDAELLDRFVQQRDEAAFELLVWRHQRMVLGVCRRVLGNAHDVEDAFQAAFLTLARKAASLRRQGAVAGWLHKVAYHIALRARKNAAKQKTVELAPTELVSLPDPTEDVIRRDLAAVLDEEVSRLPQKYRLPVVLCYLEGMTYPEAGRQLGLPIGTLSARLTRARDLLRTRLLRRGIGVPGAMLAAVLGEQTSSAAPAALVNTTVKTAAGAVSASVAALTEGVLRSMLVTKLKIGMAAMLAGLVVTGMGLLVSAGTRPQPPANQESAPSMPLASAKKKATVRVDDYGDPLPDGALRRLGTLRFRHGGGNICNLLLTPDGKRLVSNDYYGSRMVRIWEMATGKLLRQFPGTFERRNIALSANGRLVAVGQEKEIILWDSTSGKEVRRLAQPDATGFAFSPDGKILAAAGPNPDIHLWDLATGKEITKLPWKRGSTSVVLLAYTSDGKTLIAGQLFDSKIGLLDVASGRKRRELDAQGGDILSFALSPDGAILATGCRRGGVPLWDVKTGKLIRKLPTADGRECLAVAFSPNGKTLAAIEHDPKRQERFLVLWEVASGEELSRKKGDFAFWSIVFSPDSDTLIGGWGSTIRLWDVATGKEVGPAASNPPVADPVTVSPNGRMLAFREKNIRLWDMGPRARNRLIAQQHRRRSFPCLFPQWQDTRLRNHQKHHLALEPNLPRTNSDIEG
jgi:RNA polymerase sigma factor (sigma-70 family)